MQLVLWFLWSLWWWQLHQRSSQQKSTISRRWKRQDVAVSQFIQRCERRSRDARDSQSDETNKSNKKKRTELIQGCGFAPAPEDQGQRSRAGIRTRKIQRKKDIRLPEAWNCSQHILLFPLAAPKQGAKSVLEHHHKRNVEIRLLPWVKYSRRIRSESSEKLADSKSPVDLIIVQQWKFCFKCSSWQIPFHWHLWLQKWRSSWCFSASKLAVTLNQFCGGRGVILQATSAADAGLLLPPGEHGGRAFNSFYKAGTHHQSWPISLSVYLFWSCLAVVVWWCWCFRVSHRGRTSPRTIQNGLMGYSRWLILSECSYFSSQEEEC